MMTQEQATRAVLAGVMAIAAVGSAIRELGSVPNGVLYANIAEKISFHGYNIAIGKLKEAGLVTEQDHVLTWVGPSAR